jgi:polyhydroxyalkanoate synthesis repressor PhaR
MRKKQDSVLIKKYGNRRLYNTQISSYINLKDLFDLIKEKQNFTIIEAATGKDITKTCLLQVLSEQEDNENGVLSIEVLKEIICLYGNKKSSNFPEFITQAVNYFGQIKDQETLLKEDPAYNPLNFFGDLTKKNLEIFEKSFSMFYNKEKESADN